MRLNSIAHRIAHAGSQGDHAAVLQLRMHFAVEAKQDVAFITPMIGLVPGRVLDNAYADITELASPPGCNTGLARMFDRLDRFPIDRLEREILKFHSFPAYDSDATAA